MTTGIRLDGRLSVITGAAQGIGQGIAQAFAAAGSRMALVDLKREALEATAAPLRTAGCEVEVFSADLSDAQAATDLLPAVRQAMGPVDILVNNAAIMPARQIEEVSLDEWDRVMATNLRSVFILSRAVMADFQARSYGRIVNMASGAGKTGIHAPHYAASKAGVLVLTKTFATALAACGATVNAIAPGPTRTDDPARWPPAVVESLERLIPLHRMGQPADVANLVLFLASDLSGWITGQSININGGMRMD
jgi:3-oxoacyl-[acyl-carrier protein] reductase